MKAKIYFFFLLLVFVFLANNNIAQSQQTSGNNAIEKFICATGEPSQQWEAQMQTLIQELKANMAVNKVQAPVFTIPVIVHVLHSSSQGVGTYPNLAQAQINSQITVLNQDFAGVGYNYTNYPATAFTAWATAQNLPAANKDGNGRVKIADFKIQFCLATTDSLGNTLAEPGIDRINWQTKGWSNPTSFTSPTNFLNYMDNTVKPATRWNCTKYLNIWISDASGSMGVLGYAYFPPLTGLSGLSSSTSNGVIDGVWCMASCFGSAGIYASGSYYSSNYNRGRTCTHEVGHWLGLRHIWGDGTCATDYCADTPPHQTQNAGTPTYPYKAGACSGTSPNGEMFMNYMDYTYDQAKYMFTVDQSTRALTAMLNCPYRNKLGTHGLCAGVSTVSAAFAPASTTACPNMAVNLINNTSGYPTPTYTWSGTGGATFNANANSVMPSVTFTAAGIQTVTLTANNGANSTTTQTINVVAPPSVVISVNSKTVCTASQVTFTASGASTYVWSSGGGSSSVGTYSPSGSTIYTVTGTSSSGCINTATASVTTLALPSLSTSVSNSLICTGQTVTLTASGASTYTWNPGSVTNATAAVSPTLTTIYSAVGTGTNGCNNTSNITVFVNPCTGISQLNAAQANGYLVYPNPTSGKLIIKSNNTSAHQLQIEIIDVVGKVVLKQKINYSESLNYATVEMDNYPAGLYFLKLKTGDSQQQLIRIVKE